jgi:fused signal recognition particle receptor
MNQRIGDAPKLGLWSRIKRIATTDVGALMRGMNAADLEAMERVLLEADFGVKATVELTQALEDQVRRGALKTENDLRRELTERIAGLLAGPPSPERIAVGEGTGPTVVLFIGVNGVGKTTSCRQAGASSHQGRTQGAAGRGRYLPGRRNSSAPGLGRSAQDPNRFRAPGGDPAAVAFDAIEAADKRGSDTLLIDTAGRLHTQEGLMDELRKVVRVIARRRPGAPHETLLVLDATVGQNAVQQGKLFQKAVEPTGIIVTKLDGTARGGAVVALRRELDLPIRFLGVGEQAEDLQPFDPVAYAERAD